MANRTVLGVYHDADSAASGVDALREAGFSNRDYDVLTGSPYPEEAFGEHVPPNKLYVFPIIGAFCGLSVAILVNAGTALSNPIVVGGKPVLAIPAFAIIMYEGTMLGAILFTVLGVIFESRLPRFSLGVYDTRITEGYIGLIVSAPEDRVMAAETALRKGGAEDVKFEGPAPTRTGR